MCTGLCEIKLPDSGTSDAAISGSSEYTVISEPS